MRRNEDRDPQYVRACELFDEIKQELLRPFNFKLVLVEDEVAAKAAAILITRFRELNKENEINADYEEPIQRRKDDASSRERTARVSNLLRIK